MSLWQIAQAAVLIRTSPGPGSASSTVSTVNGLPNARQTAALVFMDDPGGTARFRKTPFNPARRAETSSAVLRRGAIIFVGSGAAGFLVARRSRNCDRLPKLFWRRTRLDGINQRNSLFPLRLPALWVLRAGEPWSHDGGKIMRIGRGFMNWIVVAVAGLVAAVGVAQAQARQCRRRDQSDLRADRPDYNHVDRRLLFRPSVCHHFGRLYGRHADLRGHGVAGDPSSYNTSRRCVGIQ